MSRRRLAELDDRPFAVVLPDPDSRGRWLFYVGDVFIDDCHEARPEGGFPDRESPALRSFRERASAINAAIVGLTMPDDHRAKWAVLLDAMEEKGGESLPQVARTLAVTMGVDLERLPELGPRPTPPPPPIDIRNGGPVRYVYNGTEFDAVVVAARVLPDEPAGPLIVEYSALQAMPLTLRGLPEPMRVRLEVELMVPTTPNPLERVDLYGGGIVPPDVAAELLELEPGAVVRGPTRTIEIANFDGSPPELVQLEPNPGPRDDDEPTPELPSTPRSE